MAYYKKTKIQATEKDFNEFLVDKIRYYRLSATPKLTNPKSKEKPETEKE